MAMQTYKARHTFIQTSLPNEIDPAARDVYLGNMLEADSEDPAVVAALADLAIYDPTQPVYGQCEFKVDIDGKTINWQIIGAAFGATEGKVYYGDRSPAHVISGPPPWSGSHTYPVFGKYPLLLMLNSGVRDYRVLTLVDAPPGPEPEPGPSSLTVTISSPSAGVFDVVFGGEPDPLDTTAHFVVNSDVPAVLADVTYAQAALQTADGAAGQLHLALAPYASTILVTRDAAKVTITGEVGTVVGSVTGDLTTIVTAREKSSLVPMGDSGNGAYEYLASLPAEEVPKPSKKPPVGDQPPKEPKKPEPKDPREPKPGVSESRTYGDPNDPKDYKSPVTKDTKVEPVTKDTKVEPMKTPKAVEK